MARPLASLAEVPVTRLDRLGPKAADGLAQLGVHSVLDLLTTYPRRYLDRTREARIRELAPGEEATIVARVTNVSARTARNRRRMVTVTVTDGDTRLGLTFFNQPWRERQLHVGMEVVLFGKLELFNGSRRMTNPVVDLVGDQTGRILPVYPQSEKARITSSDIARWMRESLQRAGELVDPVPAGVLARFDLTGRTEAFRLVHQPETMGDTVRARRRLVFDELLRVQLELVRRKRELELTAAGIEQDVRGDLVARFHERLPFGLTDAQRRAIDTIEGDLARAHPMHRLLQGDVGAGKTVVAVSALLVAVQGGHQGALMAPTAVLAEQHAASLRAMLEGLTVEAGVAGGTLFEAAGMARPLRVELLTNRTTAAERRRLLAALADGEVDIVIGTHALIEDAVAFRSLGVVVIDEQHRFGVDQRAALRAKSAGDLVPDVLVMTATPIPRTAAMTVYGDLDVSVLDELPPGRTPITTRWAADEAAEGEVWRAVREAVAGGHQAYVVCPLVEESDKLEVASAEETHERLTATELSDLRVGLLHGRVPPAAKEEVMEAFRRGELDVLVATTVIEVGVDVPNATVMVVLDAGRFGMAQLHQLRGRVGRGRAASACYLVGPAQTPEAEARLEAMVRSTDGFELAEIDLDLRGEGTIMGERQKGRNDLKLASLRRDREWVERARQVAIEVIADDPTLAAHPLLAEELALFFPDDDDAGEYLLKS